MKNVVGYCRFSSNNQREESIDAQKRAIKYFCQQEGYNIIHFYEDKALSGKTATKRTAFQEMIEDSKSGEFEAVVVHKLDRFSRDLGDTFQYEKKLNDNNVELISVMEKLDSSPTGVLMKTIISGINCFYLQNMSLEVMKGLKENAYNCCFTGGRPPLGYDIVDKKYVINEHQAEAIKIIFEMYGEGSGYGQIINKLNALGYKTKRGNSFGKNSLYEILHNEKYKGTYTYNKHTARKSDGSRTRTFKKDEDIIRIPNGIPAIVSEELWGICNRRLANNKQNAGAFKAKEMYLLSGLVYCGDCGNKLYGNARYPAPDRPKYVTYRCGKKQMQKQCSNREISRDDLERFVINQLKLYLFNGEIIPQLTKELNNYIKETENNAESHITKYKNRLKELETSKANIVDAITKTGFADIFTEKLQDIEREMAQIKLELSVISRNKQQSYVTEEMVQQYLSTFDNYLKEGNVAQIKNFIANYVERVDVYKEKIKVTFKVAFSFGSNKSDTVDYSFSRGIERNKLKSA